ncbi:hypothetical protein Pmani_026702 [Petrolisthes manimaculis]|uniref:Uncharacterized protein n=1 Tax=Petrolisthes manimaculis TaxID=1843537 RepID=A0AAE1P5H5_9EUCA|nr:hypothetical protein Pmani_026702 [Petrolisthes manimaculis]
MVGVVVISVTCIIHLPRPQRLNHSFIIIASGVTYLLGCCLWSEKDSGIWRHAVVRWFLWPRRTASMQTSLVSSLPHAHTTPTAVHLAGVYSDLSVHLEKKLMYFKRKTINLRRNIVKLNERMGTGVCVCMYREAKAMGDEGWDGVGKGNACAHQGKQRLVLTRQADQLDMPFGE